VPGTCCPGAAVDANRSDMGEEKGEGSRWGKVGGGSVHSFGRARESDGSQEGANGARQKRVAQSHNLR